jgi:TRAP-type mannitol/chloroaromatic compound transport system substrate-binding protein
MATVQEQYAELFKQGQDAALAALQTWNHTIAQAASQFPATGLPSPEQAIDQFYDFAGQILNAQRDLAKHLLATSTAAADKVRDTVTEATRAATQN